MLLAASTIVLVGCEGQNNEGVKGSIELSTTLFNTDIETSFMSGAKATATDINTMLSYTATVDDAGNASISVPYGVYNVIVESAATTIDGVEQKLCGVFERFSVVGETQSLSLTAYGFPTASNNSGFIISELFFNGETNNGTMMHPDQYIVIYNSSLTTLYADGLSFATTSQAAWSDKTAYYDETMNANQVAVTGIFTIPGSGAEVPVAPGEKLVIAMTAQDHSQPYEGYTADDWNAVDLSGADFEFYQVTSTSDTDNPAVPNLIVTDGVWGAGKYEGYAGFGAYMHPRGPNAAFIFKLDNGDAATIEDFLSKNSRVFTETAVSEEDGTEYEEWYNLVTVPASMILDGIVTLDNRAITTRPLPAFVDMGSYHVSGCHSGQLAIRATIEIDGKTYYQDTNNSTNDFPLQQAESPKQNAYPVGWRDLQ